MPVGRTSQRHQRTPHTIRVVLADGDGTVRARLKAGLCGHRNIRVVGEAADGHGAVRLACALKPDIALLDIDLPGLDAIGTAKELKERLPTCRAIILTMHRHGDYRRRLTAAGVKGYLHKAIPPKDLRRAIDGVFRGQTFFSDSVTQVLFAESKVGGCPSKAKVDGLTAREREILVLIADGGTNRGIAADLRIGVRTVETHRQKLMRKLQIGTVAGLTKYAISCGLAHI